jgi:Zn-dependent protease
MTDQAPPTRGIRIGTLMGARVIVQPSTVLMLGVLALVFSTGPGLELTRQTFTQGLLLAVLLFASVFLHECAHALTARAFGRQVSEIVITLWGGHTSFDATRLTPLVSGATAAAGPAANLLIAVGLQVALTAGWVGDSATGVVTWLAVANVLLAVFNALPGIPMDGGRVLEAVVWAATGSQYKAMRVAAWGGRIVALAVVVIALVLPLTRGSRPGLFELVWAGFIFMILWPAASQALALSTAMVKRETVKIRTFMVSATTVEYGLTVAQARESAERAKAVEVVVTAADGTPAGHFPVALTDAVPPDQRSSTPLQAVTMPLPRGAIVPVDLVGRGVIDALKEWWGKTDVWVVTDGDEVVGLVKLVDVLNAVQ